MGVIFSNIDLKAACYGHLEDSFGTIRIQSDVFDFDHTRYYCDEMGDRLYRQFLCFDFRLKPELLYDVKLKTVDIEQKFLSDSGRQFNLDPGGLASHHYVLLSTKNYAHRLFLNQGIYGELCYLFQRQKVTVLPWTYPEYQRDEIRGLFGGFRSKFC